MTPEPAGPVLQDPARAAAPPAPGFGPWRAPASRQRAAVAGLFVVLVLTMTDVLWSAVGIAAVGDWLTVPADSWFEDYDAATEVLGSLTVVALLVAGVLFIRWHRLAIRNTAFLGCERPDPSPTAATVGWLIPLVSLILPIISFRRIALWSRPPGAPDRRPLLMTWWLAWVLANLAGILVAVLYELAEETIAWIAVTGFSIAVSLLVFVAGVLAVKVTNTLSRDQVDKARSLAMVGSAGSDQQADREAPQPQ